MQVKDFFFKLHKATSLYPSFNKMFNCCFMKIVFSCCQQSHLKLQESLGVNETVFTASFTTAHEACEEY